MQLIEAVPVCEQVAGQEGEFRIPVPEEEEWKLDEHKLGLGSLNQN
tara:strand:- start:93 stop:230 length:138 start_codon:yes stop_codon:yes gene_type:complete